MEDRARPDPTNRYLCSLSLWQSDYHLGCDLSAGWETVTGGACLRTLSLRLPLAVCISDLVTWSDYNQDMSGSLTPTKLTVTL